MQKISTKKNFIWYYIQQFVTLSSSIITAPYLSRVLGSNNMGIFSFTFSNANFLYVIAQLGTISYGTREIVLNRDNKYEMSKVFWEIELLTVITSFASILIFCVFIFFQKEYQFYHMLWILFIVSVVFDISWLYAGVEHFDETFARNIFFKVTGIISIFIFVKQKTDLGLYIIIYSLMVLLPNISMWTSLHKYIEKVDIKSLNIFKHFKETFIYFIPAITSSVYVILDKSMIGFLISDKRENGYYDASSKIVKFGEAISSIVITRVFEPKANNLYKLNQIDKIKKLINISLHFTMFISIGIIMGLLVLSDSFVLVFFGSDFAKTGILLKIMSLLIAITSITFVLEYEFLIPSGKRSEINKYVLLGAITNFITNFIFIKYLHSIGAVITSIIAELIVMTGFFISSDNIVSVKEIIASIKNKILAGFVMSLVIIGVKQVLQSIAFNSVIISLVLEIIIGFLSYTLVLFLLKDPITQFKNQIETI